MFSHDAPKRCKFVALLHFEAGFLMTRPKTKCSFDALLRFVAGFLMTRQKHLYLMHYYTEKQEFSWRAKKVQICCIITWKSRFSHDATPNKVYIWCIITLRSRFYMTRQNSYIWCIITRKSRFSHDTSKTLIFDSLLRRKAGFLMTRQKRANLLHYYVEKQVFLWRAKNSYIWYIISWKSKFSHDATENKVHIWCIITFRSRFSHDEPKTLIFDASLRGKAGFLVTRPKTKCTFHAFLHFVACFLMTRQKL